MPISNDNTNKPLCEVLKNVNAIYVAIGQTILFQGIPLETPVILTTLSPGDSIRFEVNMIDKNLHNKISLADYLKLSKSVTIDYITDESIKSISTVGVAFKSVSAMDYASKVRFIHFEYLNSCSD